MLDDVVELGEAFRHGQSDAREELRVDELSDGVQHDLGDELGMDAAEVAPSRAALDQTLETGGVLVSERIKLELELTAVQVAAAVALLDDAVSETQDAAQAIATLLMAALAMADEWRTVDPDADVVGLVEALRDEAFEDDSGMFG